MASTSVPPPKPPLDVPAASSVADDSASVAATAMEDAALIFEYAWRNIERAKGIENMIFPKEIIWLSGAPGSGKGTMADFVRETRDLPGVIEVSSLFDHAEARRAKKEGRLLGDREVVETVMKAIMNPIYTEGGGVVVDGFPRTMLQALCIKMLFDKIRVLRAEFKEHPTLKDKFRRPLFRIAVLYVEEKESIRRQLHRGIQTLKYNKIVSETKHGELLPTRDTDLSEEKARERYRVFKSQVYDALVAIKDHFHFHFIPADGPPDDVKHHIKEEFAYQSSVELGDDSFELVRILPAAQVITRRARQNMVQRLNAYSRDQRQLFSQVLELLSRDFVHILQRQSLTGRAIIRSSSSLFKQRSAIDMALDVLSERGYFVTLEVQKVPVPHMLLPPNPDTGMQEILCRIDESWVFTIQFPRPLIRGDSK